MAASSSRRFYLADLVFAALLCGLVASLFISARAVSFPWLTFVLIVVVATSWSLFRAGRRAPTCEECGRRFIQPRKAIVPPDSCPHCGRKQLAPARSLRRVKRVIWSLLGLLVVLLVVVRDIIGESSNGRFETIALIGVLIAFGGVPSVILGLIGAGIYRSVLMRPRYRPCEACGSTIPAEPPPGPAICPQCSIRHLRPEEAKKERSRNLGLSLAFLVLLGLLGAVLLAPTIGSSAGMTAWISIPLFMLVSMATPLFALVAILLMVQLLRRRRLRSEHGAIAMARKCSGRDGEVVADGRSTIWYSGPDDPVPMVGEQMEAARRRFEGLTGDTEVAQPPRRILVFHNRGAFLTFHRRILPGIDLATIDGIQLGLPYQLITLCTAPAPCRLTDPERTIRSLAAYALLESAWGPGAPAWLQSGLARASVGTDRDGLARLNRKMVAALARGTMWSVEMFTITLNGLTRLLRRSKDPVDAHRYHQFHNQAWSIVEYFCGEQAPDDRRAALGSFLRDPRSKTAPEGSFRLHFGAGFAPFLDGWRHWVLDRGIGTYDPPPDRVRDGLLDRILPAIRDRTAQRGDRIVAIREWANAGFVLGADALIDLLRDPGDLPTEEIIWALGAVSGRDWGDEPDRWQTWWDDLPSTWDDASDSSLSATSDSLPIDPIARAPASADG